jgi:hypothetical protein
METININHVLSCSEDTFWNLAMDEEFTRTLYLDALGYQAWEQVSCEKTAALIRRVTHLVPPMLDLPSVLKKIAKSGISYEQVEVFDRAAGRLETELTPSNFRDRVTIRSTTHTEGLGAETCKRMCTATVVARIFPVSGLVERQIAAGMVRAYQRSAEYIDVYVQKRRASSSGADCREDR